MQVQLVTVLLVRVVAVSRLVLVVVSARLVVQEGQVLLVVSLSFIVFPPLRLPY